LIPAFDNYMLVVFPEYSGFLLQLVKHIITILKFLVTKQLKVMLQYLTERASKSWMFV